MAKKTLIFTIDNGSVTCEATGFTGSACEAATKEFEAALGGEVTAKTKKPEYFTRTTVGKASTQDQGAS